jgi:hypothetical protein
VNFILRGSSFRTEGIVPVDWDSKSMSLIAKNLPSEVYHDCMKEEPDTVKEIGENFGKFASSLAMKIVRSELDNR